MFRHSRCLEDHKIFANYRHHRQPPYMCAHAYTIYWNTTTNRLSKIYPAFRKNCQQQGYSRLSTAQVFRKTNQAQCESYPRLPSPVWVGVAPEKHTQEARLVSHKGLQQHFPLFYGDRLGLRSAWRWGYLWVNWKSLKHNNLTSRGLLTMDLRLLPGFFSCCCYWWEKHLFSVCRGTIVINNFFLREWGTTTFFRNNFVAVLFHSPSRLCFGSGECC